ncbi:hypothetical protein DINM_002193 [Dirofilaria immitis]|nr:hypothetical protein [Dirofilaria immitis]
MKNKNKRFFLCNLRKCREKFQIVKGCPVLQQEIPVRPLREDPISFPIARCAYPIWSIFYPFLLFPMCLKSSAENYNSGGAKRERQSQETDTTIIIVYLRYSVIML